MSFGARSGLPDLPDFGEQAACLNLDPDTFFPHEAAEPARVLELAGLCGDCPVAQACLEYALQNSVEGVWAGTSTKDRRRLRRQAGINPQSLRAQADRSLVQQLAAKGLSTRQIVDQTGIHEQTVWRALRAHRAAQTVRAVA